MEAENNVKFTIWGLHGKLVYFEAFVGLDYVNGRGKSPLDFKNTVYFHPQKVWYWPSILAIIPYAVLISHTITQKSQRKTSVFFVLSAKSVLHEITKYWIPKVNSPRISNLDIDAWNIPLKKHSIHAPRDHKQVDNFFLRRNEGFHLSHDGLQNSYEIGYDNGFTKGMISHPFLTVFCVHDGFMEKLNCFEQGWYFCPVFIVWHLF